MNLPRTVILGVCGGAVAVWLAAAATSNPPSTVPSPVYDAAPAQMRGAELASEISRLHDRLRPSTEPLHNRDLFRYRAAGSGAGSTHPDLLAPSGFTGLSPVVAPDASFKLVGLAEDAGPDGPARTAIISGAGDLFLVKVGDAVTSRYRVATISVDVVELTDVNGGKSIELVLRN